MSMELPTTAKTNSLQATEMYVYMYIARVQYVLGVTVSLLFKTYLPAQEEKNCLIHQFFHWFDVCSSHPSHSHPLYIISPVHW